MRILPYIAKALAPIAKEVFNELKPVLKEIAIEAAKGALKTYAEEELNKHK
jgi:hypothetical protein